MLQQAALEWTQWRGNLIWKCSLLNYCNACRFIQVDMQWLKSKQIHIIPPPVVFEVIQTETKALRDAVIKMTKWEEISIPGSWHAPACDTSWTWGQGLLRTKSIATRFKTAKGTNSKWGNMRLDKGWEEEMRFYIRGSNGKIQGANYVTAQVNKC